MKEYRRIRAVIDLDAIASNMDSLHKNTHPGTKLIGVVKADGYGHGAIPIAKSLEEKEYMWGFAVATGEEAMLLKNGGIRLPILVLGYPFEDSYKLLIENEVRMTVYSYDMAKAISEVAKKRNKEAYIHIKIDTGMSRIGFLADENAIEEILKIKELPNLKLEGMFTHFARADEEEKSSTNKQWEAFKKIKDSLEQRGVVFSLCHCSNSAAIIDQPEYNLDAVRAGIAMYGMYPSADVKKENVDLKPALSIISHVINVKTLQSGVEVGYGGTHVTSGVTKVVTVPMGYADGYPRSLSNKGYVLINGKEAPVIGRICMDIMMVDATDIDVNIGDEVIIVGKCADKEVTVDELADLSGRFSYEFVCDLDKRIPREYVKNGRVVLQRDTFK